MAFLNHHLAKRGLTVYAFKIISIRKCLSNHYQIKKILSVIIIIYISVTILIPVLDASSVGFLKFSLNNVTPPE